ncbi:acetyl-mannosamine transferase [Terribacillus saccharophilus]|uniref:Acetyl-mannosamine transferase n=2 Tax=Terribacillus saccharophilus TaxID=361277 RepID=A0ABX4GY50_9BACI|nr:acetyl-mannosamine transferase [Terribacillus saccharophilus]PAD96031.1 acetyl-mannosamine transferase [Terribacillus saccharophilus]PAD99806.1 acetyl-mannosamine transferase [Terribacillus saccharophilus]
MNEAIIKIDKEIQKNKKTNSTGFVVTPNVDHLVNIRKDEEFRKIYKEANLKFVDGMPILFLSKFFKKPFKEKVSGSDLTPRIMELAYQKEYKVFIFGSKEGVAELAAKKCKEIYGQEIHIDVLSPEFGFEKNLELIESYKEIIKISSPDILLVSLGSPKGEYFIASIQDLNIPISLQVGASIDFIAGTVKRAPVWMQRFGLEWFYRFIKEPKRMFKRYFVNDMKFINIVAYELFSKKDRR